MKVIIGPYKNYIGPYQIAEAILFWLPKQRDELGFLEAHPLQHRFGHWLAETKLGKDSWLARLCQWFDQKRKRNIYVRIDRWDTWGMDNTLAHIVLPMLKQLKATKHGSPHTDDFDTPQHLWSTNAKPKTNEWDTDEFWHQRWDYIIGEMIWAFEQELDEHAEDKFYEHCTNKELSLEQQIENIKVDEQGLNQHNHRKQNGFRLFGKYYQALWD